MKGHNISFFFSFLLILSIILSGCDDLMGGNGGINAQQIQKPENYMNITDEIIAKYPHLQEALNRTGESIGAPGDEWYSLKDFFGGYAMNISYQDKYYHVRLFGVV